MDIRAFGKRLEELLGFDAGKARLYAGLIGDTPEVDADGKIVVRDWSGQVIDRVSIPV